MLDRPLKILSIEDDEFMKIFLRDVFWIHGVKYNFELTVVSNVKQAEGIVADEKTKPDLILLDLMLPYDDDKKADMSAGFQFLEKLKADPNTKNIKVIVFSGFSDNEIKKRAIALGAEKFLLKGEYLPNELIEVTKEITDKL